MPITVLIADDHSIVRQGLHLILNLDPELQVIGEASNGKEALKMAHQFQPDVILMDVAMPVMDGIATTIAIRQELPDCEVVALTSILDDATVVSVVRAGAIGYLLKDNTRPEDLYTAIKAAAAGQVHLSPQAAALLMREVRSPEAPPFLSQREIEVLRLLAGGKSNREIACQLVISEKTVKHHVSSLLAKLDVQSRTQAVLYAMRIGLISPEKT